MENGRSTKDWRPHGWVRVRMRVSVATDTGKVRQRNEDSYVVDTVRGLFAVCDGMGGHRGGDVASRLAVRNIHAWIKDNPPGSSITPLEGAIQHANRMVWEESQKDAELKDMGTTATAALIWENRLFIGHVGDSALYLIRNQQIDKLTRDHTLAEQMVSKGLITGEESRNSAYNHILTRAIGIAPRVEIDSCQIPLAYGDVILICSDGLSDLLTPQQMLEIYRQNPGDLNKIAEELVQTALSRGGHDNITLILLLID